ncbi:MAG: curli production assembly/transport protein CsgE [Flavobacteriaceae bacterium]|nr:curli production assembly/transport protein CsgE [Flavobacteriaceae bacterium]
MLLYINRNIVFTLTFLISTTCIFSQKYNTQVEAKIDLKSNTEFIEITGSAFNNTQINQSLRYQLSVFKKGQKNTNISNNKQEGRIVLAPGQKKNVSSTTINANDEDRIIILLLLYNLEDQLLGKDRIVINGNAEDKNNEIVAKKNESSKVVLNEENDGVFLRGIVIEETKTKPGRDFYKMFYSLYLGYNVNGEKIVIVKEKLALANNTKIEVFVHNDKVFEFFLRPQNEYLKIRSEEALKKVYLHLQKLKQNKNRVQHY